MEKFITAGSLAIMEHRFRAALINSLGGFKSVCLVGTKHEGKSNLAIFSSIVHLGANPPLVGMIVRPDSVERHTYENILANGFYTLNHISSAMVEQAHQTSARYKREESEFECCGLTEEYRNEFFAPFVKESKVKIGLMLRETKAIELNGTILVIGEIQQIHLNESSIGADGFIDLEATDTVTCSGLDCYHSTIRLGRYSYAKPDKWPSRIG